MTVRILASSVTRSRAWWRCSTTPYAWWPIATSQPSDFVQRHTQDDLVAHGDERRATTRIFGSKPGSYGAGILPLIEAGNWRNDHDLAEVYSAWGGFAYGRDLDGIPARQDMEANYRRIAVAAKNVDTRSMTSPMQMTISNTGDGGDRPR